VIQRASLMGALAVSAVALGVVGSSGAATRGVPRGYALLTVLRAPSVTDRRTGFYTQIGDGGGWVRSVQAGLDANGRPRRIACRMASVDRTGKEPFQSDPLGICALYFPTDRVIELTEHPDFRSRGLGWESRNRGTGAAPVIVSACSSADARPGRCVAPAANLKLVVRAASTVSVRFALKTFRLSVVNTDPTFGLVEDHTRVQVGIDPILCGAGSGSANRCAARFEYGTHVVLDAQWDPTRTLTVSWDGCDTAPAGSPPTNEQLCPVTMTRDHRVTIYWH
jgi:hypothetical protein